MTETTVGREPVQIVELVQPFCANTFGTSPCTATGAKCFNTRATCQDADNFDRSELSLFFANSMVWADATKIELGAELLTNGGFGADTDWIDSDTGSGASVIANGELRMTYNTVANLAARDQAFPTVAGKKYRLTVSHTGSQNHNAARVSLGTTQGGTQIVRLSYLDSAEYEFTALSSETWIRMYHRNTHQWSGDVAYGSVSIKEITYSPPESGVGAPYIIPSLVSVSTSPTKINLSAANPDASGLGNRAVCNITFRDHPHSDRVVDPYLSDRAYDPMQRGSFWSKWMKRNKYRYNMTIRVYDGYAGQVLSEMTKRSYILTAASGPDEKGAVKIQGKDILAKLEERKAQIPEASPGLLFSDIDASQTEFKVQAATVSDYAASGTLRINDELMTYSAVALAGAELQFTISERGADGTTAAGHSQEDQVQDCIRYTDEPVQDIVEDLLTRADIDASYIDSTSFDDESADFLTAYKLSTVLSEPIAITTLISELQVQCSFMIWWDERTAKIKMKAVRGITETPDLLTDDANILAGSFSVSDLPKSRVSQLWFYFARRDVVGGLDAPNFAQVYIQADLASESDDQFGEPSIRKVFSRWVDSSGQALSTSSKLISRYRDVPRQCKFRLDAKDRTYWVGDTVRISHFLDVDEFGERTIANWTIVSAEEVTPGEVVEYVAEDTTLYGQVSRIQADGASDYSTGDSLFLGWIGDASGLLSDGEKSSRTA